VKRSGKNRIRELHSVRGSEREMLLDWKSKAATCIRVRPGNIQMGKPKRSVLGMGSCLEEGETGRPGRVAGVGRSIIKVSGLGNPEGGSERLGG